MSSISFKSKVHSKKKKQKLLIQVRINDQNAQNSLRHKTFPILSVGHQKEACVVPQTANATEQVLAKIRLKEGVRPARPWVAFHNCETNNNYMDTYVR